VFVDNYYHFLAVTDFHPHVECVQLWHAAGAIKQFGLKDHKVNKESAYARKRFRRVYDRFSHVVVGSEKMADVFQESFGLSNEQMLKTGVPRTDFFYDNDEINYVKHLMYMEFPIFKQKKVILYAPTYRDGEFNVSTLHLDIKKMYDQLKYDYVLLLKLHPAVNGTFENKHPGFAFNMSNYPNVNHLLTIADVLVTDYSSVPFEYSILRKPMIFYPYDLDVYEKVRGLQDSYEQFVPGPVVAHTEELIGT